jgi:hypothetical protein
VTSAIEASSTGCYLLLHSEFIQQLPPKQFDHTPPLFRLAFVQNARFTDRSSNQVQGMQAEQNRTWPHEGRAMSAGGVVAASGQTGKAQLEGVERRYCFAVWPQVLAHSSWLDALDLNTGLRLSRAYGFGIGGEEAALARCLLQAVGARLDDRVADAWLPLWVLQAHASMRQHLSTVAASLIATTLRAAVSAAQSQQWDATLGADVRRAALVLSRQADAGDLPPDLDSLRRLALLALQEGEAAWDRFCLAMGLAATETYGGGVRARMRLAWPQHLADVPPLNIPQALQPWLAQRCEQGSHLQRQPAKPSTASAT